MSKSCFFLISTFSLTITSLISFTNWYPKNTLILSYKENTDDNWDMKITFEEWVFDMFGAGHVEIDETWTEKDLKRYGGE